MVPEVTFSQLGVDRLRFFLRGPANQTFPLYELLVGHVVSVAYADDAVDPAPVIVRRGAVEPGGFGPEEALLPWSARGFSGFRLMTEYFAFPEKFLFVDFCELERKTLLSCGNRLEIFVYLDRPAPELERMIGQQSLALGCVPLVNLFPQRCEPIPLTHTDTEYRLEADARRPRATEIWGVQRVRETLSDGTQRPWYPFHRLTESATGAGIGADRAGGFYHLARRDGAFGVPGSEVFLAPHDPGFDPEHPGDTVLSVDALCLNRDLPTDLPFGGGRPMLRLVEGIAAVSAITAVSAATTTLRAPLRDKKFWRLISHLSLGHLSVTGGPDGAAVLKEVLRLYDFRDTAETRAAIDGITGIVSEAGVARAPDPPQIGQQPRRRMPPIFCRGLDISVEMEPRAWQVGGLFLLASVLERFFALNATINSFTRTKVVLRGRSGNAAAWPARSGTRLLG
jgi:type VI secretion system protein ImpG